MMHKLLNLSHVARFIHSAVEAQVRRKVQHNAIVMALSRLQNKLVALTSEDELELERINIQSGLAYFMVPKNQQTRLEVNSLAAKVIRKDGFINTTNALGEISVCVEEAYLDLAKKSLSVKLEELDHDIAALELTFKEAKCGDPGTAYQVLEQVALHRLNIVNISTASCQLSIYMTEEDASLAYNALYQRFIKKV